MTTTVDTRRMTKKSDPAPYALRIKAAMAHASLDATQLEEKCEFGQGFLSRHLSGERQRIDAERLARIAVACGVSNTWLASGLGEMAPAKPLGVADTRTIVRDGDAPTGDDETPLERAITAAFDPSKHSRHDLNAAAEAARSLHRLAKEGSDPSWARDFLDAARAMRVERELITPQTVKDRVIAMRMAPSTPASRKAAHDANEEARRLSEAFDAPSTGKRR